MIQRMGNVGIVVNDLAATTAFFVEFGLEVPRRSSSIHRRRAIVSTQAWKPSQSSSVKRPSPWTTDTQASLAMSSTMLGAASVER
jgi:hypothetical protein